MHTQIFSSRFAVACACAALLAGASSVSTAQEPAPSAGPGAQSVDACRRVVSRFEQDIALLRGAQGNEAAAKVKEQLLPSALENELLMRGGYCALAAHLKKNKLAD